MVTIVLGVVKCWSGVSYSLVERAHSWRAYSGNQSVDLRDEKCVVVSSVRFFFRSSFDFVPPTQPGQGCRASDEAGVSLLEEESALGITW